MVREGPDTAQANADRMRLFVKMFNARRIDFVLSPYPPGDPRLAAMLKDARGVRRPDPGTPAGRCS